MTFLISLETPTRGSYVLGCLELSDFELKEKEVRKKAQQEVVELLVSQGFERDKISIQVTDYTSLEIGVHRVQIIFIKEFDGVAASTLSAILR